MIYIVQGRAVILPEGITVNALQATLNSSLGHKWPLGLRLPTPDIDHWDIKWLVLSASVAAAPFSLAAVFLTKLCCVKNCLQKNSKVFTARQSALKC